ncbi:MAG: universal stress protein [Bryobacterales bacterium]|nr:universal stress protein [Bryobacterales bacterium]MBV9398912.1 universal stress protein [Bryobacterales bacterium]
MFQIQHILFPVDFSDRSRAAASYAEEFAAHYDAELILLHVVEPPDYNTALTDSHRQHAEGFDKFFGHGVLQKLRVQRIITHGDATAKIIEAAGKHNADLIMIPTQGMGVYRRLIIGSTSAKVLHDADCPVWSGVHWEHVLTPEKIHYRRICCAVDLKPHSAKVLDWANEFARSYDAQVTVIHVGNVEQTGDSLPPLVQLQQQTGSSAAVLVEQGEPAYTIARLAGELQADLLVIGRGAESGIMGRLVATAYSIIRQSPCPVVSV